MIYAAPLVDILPNRTLAYSVLVVLLSLFTSQVKTSNHLVLLTTSLRTFQKHACDGEELRLQCPPGTVISISVAQYGRPSLQSSSRSAQPCPTEDEFWWKDRSQCLAENAVSVIEKTCQKQRVCRLWTSPETFQEDPCPEVPKFAEVAYKCRPDVFTNRVVCEGERLRLHCNETHRIVILYAAFGSVKSGVIECPQNPGVVDEDCIDSFSTEKVQSICAGRRKCSIAADIDAFGAPFCTLGVRKHLKVVSTCLPQEIVTPPHYGPDYEDDSNLGDSTWSDFPLMTNSNPSRARDEMNNARLVTRSPRKPFYANTTVKKLEIQNDEIFSREPVGESKRSDQKVVGLIAQWISAKNFITGNKEKLILYVAVSLGVGLIIFLAVVGIKLFHLRVLSRQKHQVSSKNQEQFPEDSSDFEPDERPPSLYSSRISVRRQDSDVHPRTPVTNDANHYYI